MSPSTGRTPAWLDTMSPAPSAGMFSAPITSTRNQCSNIGRHMGSQTVRWKCSSKPNSSISYAPVTRVAISSPAPLMASTMPDSALTSPVASITSTLRATSRMGASASASTGSASSTWPIDDRMDVRKRSTIRPISVAAASLVVVAPRKPSPTTRSLLESRRPSPQRGPPRG